MSLVGSKARGKRNRINYSFLAFIFLAFFISWKAIQNAPKNILSWDTYGHYLYLPATFIHADPLIEDFDTIDSLRIKYDSAPYFYVGYTTEKGNTLIKYPMGFSVLMSPFFSIGHGIALARSNYNENYSHPCDGFSSPYQWSILLGSLFYVITGLYVLMHALRIWFSDHLTAFLMLLLVFGTNYYFMVIHSQGMIHGILFCFYALLIYSTHKWHKTPNLKWSIIVGSILGILALTRASEVIAILIPLLWGIYNKATLQHKIALLKANSNYFYLTIGIYVLWGVPQLLYWKVAAGSFFVDSYQNPGEGFDLVYPHTWDYLFSFRKGWLLYTPLMILGIIGLFKSRKPKYNIGIAFVVFAVVNIYLLSSWTNWWYAESFGQRSIIQSYPIFLIGLGFFLKPLEIKPFKVRGTLTIFLMSVCIGLNLFQTWQVNNGLLHLSRMTKEVYFAHFLQINPHKDYEELLLIDPFKPASYYLEQKNRYVENGTHYLDFEKIKHDDDRSYSQNSFQGKRSALLTNDSPYSMDLRIPYHTISSNYHAIIKVSAFVYCKAPLDVSLPTLVCKFRHKEKEYFAHNIDVEKGYKNMELYTWNKIETSFITPNIRHSSDDLQVFGWLRGQGSFAIDHIKIEVFVEK